jgi:hypothetical protein
MKSTNQVIKELNKLQDNWPKGISLFSNSGTLLLIEDSTNKILTSFSIPSDGGNARIILVDDEEYLNN